MFRVYYTRNDGTEYVAMETDSEYLAKDWKRCGEISVRCGLMKAVRIEFIA